MKKTLKKLALLSVAVLGAACAPSTSSSSESTQASSGSDHQDLQMKKSLFTQTQYQTVAETG